MLTLITLYVVSIILILLPIYINYRIDKRRFDRRNAAGIEIFSSYGNFRLVTWLENCITFFAIFLRVVGCFLLLFALVEGKVLREGWHANKPVSTPEQKALPGGKPFLRKSLHRREAEQPDAGK